MDLFIAFLAALTGYLLGSISFARIIMRFAAPDEELTGMELDMGGAETFQVETVGGTAISVKLGAKYGMITSLFDILKAVVPALAFKLLYPGMPYYLFAATMALVGHNWPLYHRFKGGRGMSPMYGGFLVVDWIGTLVTAVLGMFLGLAVLRNVLVSWLLGPWLMIPWLWFRTMDPWHVGYAIAVNLLFVLAMIPEFRTIQDQKRRGVEGDQMGALEATPMGRGMRKMGERLGLLKDIH
ncbi:MAG: glycerol-3-phosphate acyltransferase [Anaerolineae bacterium]|jgi:glycerol-3-phosphate acyltransferase PlsY